MPYVIEVYREGALVARPAPYDVHIENAKHVANRLGVANRGNFVRVLDEDGRLELWSERLDAKRP
ncbi:hypothetical protein CI1B_25990 [Bradyrhizobium ivorense]|uniref:Uncharacterized protein n=1 Tax=Bradyrhizobium ivorense TaxID=2511166 RepID=A0A508T336_9BRAD|nr:hypothetical protein CI1B_25990 [Bradyrhizobium ivorense]